MPAITRSMSFAVGEKHVGLSGADTEKFQELCDNFYQASGWADKYSEGFVSDLLRKVLGELYKSNHTATAEAALSKHLSDYRAYQKSHFVLVPLFGIALHVPSLKIGRVTFIQPSNSVLAQRLGKNVVTQPGQYILKTLSGMCWLNSRPSQSQFGQKKWQSKRQGEPWKSFGMEFHSFLRTDTKACDSMSA